MTAVRGVLVGASIAGALYANAYFARALAAAPRPPARVAPARPTTPSTAAAAAAPTTKPAKAAADADPGAVPDLVHQVATSRPRPQLTKFLDAPARRAAAARDYRRALPLYQALALAHGPRSPAARQLAALTTEAEAAARTAGASAAPTALAPAALTAEARRAFSLGRAAFAARRYGDALVYYHVGQLLAPDLPGFLRELGATYDKLGADGPKREFYRRYLVQRPYGSNADLVRGELAKQRGGLGTLVVRSSLPCTELWVNRQRLTAREAASGEGIAVAPGAYKGLCFVPGLEMALYEYATVEAGQRAELSFRWAVIENQLERPLGRIALENAKSPGTMIDLGITAKAVGVAAPGDGRTLRMVLQDDSGMRREERRVSIAPGQRLAVRW